MKLHQFFENYSLIILNDIKIEIYWNLISDILWGIIHIQSKCNSIKTEAVIPNKNISKFYLISKNKRFNSNVNLTDKTDLKNDIP